MTTRDYPQKLTNCAKPLVAIRHSRESRNLELILEQLGPRFRGNDESVIC